jgi:uncharacterized protein (TIGR01777 family)
MKKESLKHNTKVLISGGSGLIGMHLTSLLLSEGINVAHLSRQNNHFGRVRVYRWDPDNQVLDPVILQDVDYIIHLAGANIGEKRWTSKRKREIVDSRASSTGLLYKTVAENNIRLKAFITASAIGYYGSITSERIFSEEDPPADDFTGNTCRMWEEMADKFIDLGIRTVKIRTAVVLDKSDSVLSRLLRPARFGIYPLLGNGRQYMPWIHISDLCNIYLNAIRKESMHGTYNAVAPQHVTQKEFMKTLAGVMNRPFFHPPVPSFLLKLMLGELSGVIVNGNRISSVKIINEGVKYTFADLHDALDDLVNAR